MYAELREELRKMQVERERNRDEKGNGKEEDEQMEEFKRKAKKARETLEKTNTRLAELQRVMEADRQADLPHKGMGTGSKKGNAAVAAATILGDGPESRMVDIPLNERWGGRGEIEPLRTLEERLFEDTCDWCGRRG